MSTNTEKTESFQRILEILPHRHPFLFVDGIVEEEKPEKKSGARVGWKAQVFKNVDGSDFYFEGHFPNEPIMPAVLMIEAMAQAAIIAAFKTPPEGKAWNYRLVGVKKSKFRKPVLPGDRLDMEAKIVKEKGTMLVFETSARVGGDLVASAEIMASMYI